MLFADRTLAQRLERTEAQANINFVETRARLQPESGARWLEVAGAHAMFDGTESPLTQTFGLGLFEEVRATELQRLEEFFAEHRAPVFHEISPLADATLWPLLAARGYHPVEHTSVLYRELHADQLNLAATPNPQLHTRLVSAAEADLWARTSAQGWDTEHPGLGEFMFAFGQISAQSAGAYPFVAELNGVPIATGGLSIHEHTALLAGASTVPEGRRQGAQLALLEARLRHAATLGCTVAMMGALPGSQSQRNAEKQGFRIAYTRTKWQLGR